MCSFYGEKKEVNAAAGQKPFVSFYWSPDSADAP